MRAGRRRRRAANWRRRASPRASRERDRLNERLSDVVAERDRSVRDAGAKTNALEETRRALELETTTRDAVARRARREQTETRLAATAMAARAFALSAAFGAQMTRSRAVAKRARFESRVSRANARRARDASRGAEARVARLEAEVASLEDALRETKSRTRHEIERVASLVERGEEAERVSRLRVAYARECERRLTVATAEKIRLARALEALGGKDALETRRATRG